MTATERYKLWLSRADEATRAELASLNDKDEIYDRFYKDAEFGTGGMRGIIGAGTNRINRYTIAAATAGFAEYIIASGGEKKGVAIAHDNRRCSREFAEVTAGVLCAAGIKTYLFKSLRTTPELSFAVRELGCFGGVVITASHNPPEYNGYKLYDETGCQLIPADAQKVIDRIADIKDPFAIDIRSLEKAGDLLSIIGEDIDRAYYEKVLSLQFDPEVKRDIRVVYTPQHGTGNLPVRHVLKEAGFEVLPVLSQCTPDPDFSATENPNPEMPEAYKAAIRLMRESGAELAIATDPDCDRLGAVIHCGDREQLLTGNQSGAIILYYILSRMKERGTLPENGVMFNTVVTSTLGDRIAESFGLSVEKTLTGFKFIGDKIKTHEKLGDKTFVFGYEESYGCLIRDFVRDKDAVQASLMFCEAADYYKKQGKTLVDVLEEIFERYGYYADSLVSLTRKGEKGAAEIAAILDSLRSASVSEIAGMKLKERVDFLTPPEGFIPSNVLLYRFVDGSFAAVRPSGTEPKCKFYFSVRGATPDEARDKTDKLKAYFEV